jgi:hypothetical protein
MSKPVSVFVIFFFLFYFFFGSKRNMSVVDSQYLSDQMKMNRDQLEMLKERLSKYELAPPASKSTPLDKDCETICNANGECDLECEKRDKKTIAANPELLEVFKRHMNCDVSLKDLDAIVVIYAFEFTVYTLPEESWQKSIQAIDTSPDHQKKIVKKWKNSNFSRKNKKKLKEIVTKFSSEK